MDNLQDKMDWTFKVFGNLPKDEAYQLCFSGGKDSHVLLGMYLLWSKRSGIRLDMKVVFADTLLESASLYKLVESVEALDIQFKRVVAPLKDNFWVKLFGYGYVVPNHRARWCTKLLKVKPMNTVKGKPLTGSHLGESTQRNNRINTCGSSECGIDLMNGTIEPLSRWTNCDVWDWIAIHGDAALYSGFCDNISNTYNISESAKSLRMGCFMCPVVSPKTLAKNVEDGVSPPITLKVSELLEDLRKAKRINSPRTKKAGAILVDERIKAFKSFKLLTPELKELGFVSEEVIEEIEKLLLKRSYPPTYKREWIKEQELILLQSKS